MVYICLLLIKNIKNEKIKIDPFIIHFDLDI